MSKFETIVFPGQGSQRPGMGLDLLASHAAAREVFARAGSALGYDLAELCQGADERLNLTEYAQPAILTVEVALLETLRALHGLAPRWFGGHSLGEYAALVAADALPFETAVKVVRRRGQLMQEAVSPGLGKMVALIRDQAPSESEHPPLPIELIRRSAARASVEIANKNSPFQVVISGMAAAVDQVTGDFQAWADDERMRIIPLSTSAPFHSRHMRSVEPAFRQELDGISSELAAENARQVVSNFTGSFHTGSKEDLIDSLVRQVSGTVLWERNMRVLSGKSTAILEAGPDRPLRSFFLALGINVVSITDVRTLERAFRSKEGSHA